LFLMSVAGDADAALVEPAARALAVPPPPPAEAAVGVVPLDLRGGTDDVDEDVANGVLRVASFTSLNFSMN
jgi:hypothetical protein